jgi:hypothetical protein
MDMMDFGLSGRLAISTQSSVPDPSSSAQTRLKPQTISCKRKPFCDLSPTGTSIAGGGQDVSPPLVFRKAQLVNRFYDEPLAFHHTRKVFPKYPKVVALPEILDAVFFCTMDGSSKVTRRLSFWGTVKIA